MNARTIRLNHIPADLRTIAPFLSATCSTAFDREGDEQRKREPGGQLQQHLRDLPSPAHLAARRCDPRPRATPSEQARQLTRLGPRAGDWILAQVDPASTDSSIFQIIETPIPHSTLSLRARRYLRPSEITTPADTTETIVYDSDEVVQSSLHGAAWREL